MGLDDDAGRPDALGRLAQGWRDELIVLAAMLGLGLFALVPLRHALFGGTALLPGLVIFPCLAAVQFALLRRRMRARGLAGRQDLGPYALGAAIALAPAVLGADRTASGVALWLVVPAAGLAALAIGGGPAALVPAPRPTMARWLAAGLLGPAIALAAALPTAWGAGVMTMLAAVPVPQADGQLGEIAEAVPPALRPRATHVWRLAHRDFGELIPETVQVSFRLPPAEARAWQAALAREGRREVRRPALLAEVAGPDAKGYELVPRRHRHVALEGSPGYGLGYQTTVEGAIGLADGQVFVESARAMNPEPTPASP